MTATVSAILALSALSANGAAAADATYTVSGQALGILDGNPFETGFTFVVEADFSALSAFPDGQFFEPVSVVFSIDGFTPVALAGDYFFGQNVTNNAIFLGSDETADIFDFSYTPPLDITQSFGPLAGGEPFALDQFVNIETSGGLLTVTRATGIRFMGEVGEAPAIPEPATWAMLIIGFGVVGMAARRRTAQPAARQGRPAKLHLGAGSGTGF
jgi:hypothetical protein